MVVEKGSIPSRRHRHHGQGLVSRARCPRPGSLGESGGRDLRSPVSSELRRFSVHVADYVWYITVGVLLALLAFDVFIIGRRPHEPTTRESATAIAFYIGLAVLFGLGVWVFSGGNYAGRVLRRLADRVQPERRQPVHLPHHHGQVRGAEEIPADRAADRHHPGAGLPRHLHRGRRGRDQRVLLGVLPVRRVPGLHRDPPGQAGRERRRGLQGERGRPVRREAADRHRRVQRRNSPS